MHVREERGDVVARAGDRTAFPLRYGLDPYGDAVFNGRQVPVLLEELGRLPTERGGAWVEEVRTLCGLVLKAPHRYLWFVGD